MALIFVRFWRIVTVWVNGVKRMFKQKANESMRVKTREPEIEISSKRNETNPNIVRVTSPIRPANKQNKK